MKRHIFPRTDAIIVPGNDGRDYALSYGASPDRIITLPHPLDERFRNNITPLTQTERRDLRNELSLSGTSFVYVGRLWRGKGLDTLLDAFAIVQRTRPDVSLLMVGEGDEHTTLARRSECLGLQNVNFCGFRETPFLPRLYAACDVFVFPTLGDPYGLVVDEAMACALPVISTSAAGEIIDRIEPGRSGFIVPPADTHALAAKMLELADNPKRGTAMGAAGKAKISTRTTTRWCEEFEAGVAQILSLPRV